MKSIVRAIPRMRDFGVPWLLASAVLFLVGASRFNGAGMKELAGMGVGSAIAAIAVIIAFFS